MSNPWVAPDSGPATTDATAAPPAPPRPTPASASPSRTAPAAVADAGPTPLGPMTAADILDGAFEVLKRRFRPVVTIALVITLPLQVVTSYLARSTLVSADFGAALSGDPTAFSGSEGSTAGDIAIVLSIFGESFTLALVTAAVAHLVARWYLGEDVPAGAALGVALRRAPALLAAWFLVHLAELAGAVALLVGAVLVMGLFTVTTPTIVLERVGPLAGMRRAAGLARRSYGKALGVSLLVMVVSLSVSFALSTLPQLLAVVAGDLAWVIVAASGTLTNLVILPFVASASVLLYLDLRIRSEGMDLALEADRVF